MVEVSPKAFAILGKVRGGWFWGVWASEDVYWERTKRRDGPEKWGIECSQEVARLKIEEMAGQRRQILRSSWRVKRALQYALNLPASEPLSAAEPIIDESRAHWRAERARRVAAAMAEPEIVETQLDAALRGLMPSSVAESHLKLIERERERRKEVLERERQHIEENARKLGALNLSNELEFDELLWRLRLLVQRLEELRTETAINDGTSWVPEFLAQVEAHQAILNNPALHELVINGLANDGLQDQEIEND